MSAPDDLNGLGPLPQSDRQSELQELSIRAFQQALPVDRFVLRDERTRDAGVDASLELLIGGRYTNLRSQVQLKGTDSARTNTDGSVSLPVATSNLNYLLNGSSSLYVLYVVPRDELRFAWASDVRKQLDQINPSWMQQDTVTIRFEQIVTPEALVQVHERIRREAQLNRQIHDVLGRASTAEHVTVRIDSETLRSTDPDELAALITTSGIAIVDAGYASQILDTIEALSPSVAKTPRVQLVQGYATYMVSQYQAAYAALSKALLRRNDLSADDQQFLLYLRNACELQIGRINVDEYLHRISVWLQQATGVFADSLRLHYLYYVWRSTQDPERRLELKSEIRGHVGSVLAQPGGTEGFKLQARLTWLAVEGGYVAEDAFNELHRLGMRLRMQGEVDFQQALRVVAKPWLTWKLNVDQALVDAERQQHPRLLAEALLIRASTEIAYSRQMRLLAKMFNVPFDSAKAFEPLFSIIQANVEQAMTIYSQAEHLEGELRAKLLLADIYELLEQVAAAQLLAQEVLPTAQAMAYGALEEWAQEHLTGSTFLQGTEAKISQATPDTEDLRLAAHNDDEIQAWAKAVHEALELPADRLPVVERDCMAERAIAREHVDWCRHLDLLQNLRHQADPSTLYRTDPGRLCRCSKYGHQSAIEYPDADTVIAAFKAAYCAACRGRDPKQRPS